MCDHSVVGVRHAVAVAVAAVVEHMVAAAALVPAHARGIRRKDRVRPGRRRRQVNGSSARKVKAALRTRRRRRHVRSSRGMSHVPRKHRHQLLARLSAHRQRDKATVAVVVDAVSIVLPINSRSGW